MPTSGVVEMSDDTTLSNHPEPESGLSHTDRIGPYKILQVLGEGGMGVVYEAEQTEPITRLVALKIIKLGMDTREIVARFEAERQALAVMQHPSIAQVFDAGTTDTGQPFFVMELVRGTPLVEYCDQHRLTVRQRAKLFVQACRAVQHAHQKGVIHRDLKPSNMMVTEADGQPLIKIIDFGIAKATERPFTEETFATEVDHVVGTPAYISPEQAGLTGVDVDTRTDLYSLGVTLYNLLTGALPFESEAYRGWALFVTAAERDPPTPSRRLSQLGETQLSVAGQRSTDPTLLERELRGDLDWIVMKAMDKDRDQRYETAEGMAMDLLRYLGHEPVLARPPSTGYRVRKFVRRNKIGVGFAAVLLLLLSGFAIAQTVQARIIAEARDDAEARKEQAEGVLDFMLTDLRAKLEAIGRLEILNDVGDQALAYFAALPEEDFSEEELLSRSQALYQIGSVRLNEGKADAAVSAFEESLRLARALAARDTANGDWLFGLSQSHFWVGYAAWQRGNLESAEQEFQGYLRAAVRLVALDRDNLDYRMELAYAHGNIGSVREARGDLEGAVEAYSRTLAAKVDLVQRSPDNLDWLGELAETHNKLGVAYRKLGRYSRALEEHRREYELKTELLNRDPTHTYWRYRLAMAHHFMGRLQMITGDGEGALRNQEAATAMLDSLVAYDPANTEWRQEAAVARRQLAVTLGRLGRPQESLRAFREALSSLEDLVLTDSTGFEWRRYLGSTRSALARALVAFGEPAAALHEAETAQTLLADAPAEGQALRRARSENDLVMGHAFFGLGREREARVAWNRALAALLQLVEGPGGAEFRPMLAEAYVVLDRTDEARRELEDLRNQGYRELYLRELATERGIVP